MDEATSLFRTGKPYIDNLFIHITTSTYYKQTKTKALIGFNYKPSG